MASVQSLLRRVQRLEAAQAAPRSPFEVGSGSMDAFADETQALIDAGKLDRVDMGAVLTALRRWHADRVFSGFKYRRDGSAEYGR